MEEGVLGDRVRDSKTSETVEDEVTDSESDKSSLSTDDPNTENEKRKLRAQSGPSTKKIMKKRLQKYKSEWEIDHKWLRPVKDNEYQAKCTDCDVKFSIGSGGIATVKQHSQTQRHISTSDRIKKNSLIDQFIKQQKTSSLKTNTAAAELSLAYHCVEHHQSYNSLDCLIKLLKIILQDKDSDIVSKMHLGKTKAEALVTDVLAPYALSKLLDDLKNNDIYFCVQSDASNKKNVKFFPLALQYFTYENGIENKMLDFYENSNETADGMYKALCNSLSSNGLGFDKISGLSADNANNNFGTNHSLFTNLKEDIPDLIKGNCHAHIIHNCANHAMNNLDVDVENVVLKIYAHFSKSAVRREKLKEFVEFCEAEWHELRKHVSTRWVSLLPCTDNLYRNWLPIKNYFISLGDDCPKNIQNALLLTKDLDVNDVEANVNSDENNVADKVEVYLTFVSHILYIFHLTILSLEGNKISILDVFSIMTKCRKELESRKKDKFFGIETKNLLKKFSKEDQDKILKNFDDVLASALSYLDKWFDFSDSNWLYLLKDINLKNCLKYDQITDIVDSLNLQKRLDLSTKNMDELYSEVRIFNELFNEVSETEEFKNCANSADRWHFIFKKSRDFPLLFKIVSFLLSIPASSAFIERIFSIMNIKWRNERNRASLKLIKSELLVYFNLKESCANIREVFLKEKGIIENAVSQNKYNFLTK